MPIDYKDRVVSSVVVAGFNQHEIAGVNGISTEVVINLSGSNGQPGGPTVRMLFAFPATPETSIREIECEALEAASGILDRLAKESALTLAEVHKNPLIPAFVTPPVR